MEQNRLLQENQFSHSRLVDHPPPGYIGRLHHRSSTLEGAMIKYFLLFTPGWWILHLVVIGFTLYLGHLVRFHF